MTPEKRPMPGMPLPDYGQRLAELDKNERMAQGRPVEWRIMEIVKLRWEAEGHNIILQQPQTKQDKGGTDGIFIENGVTSLHQSKSRERGQNGRIYDEIGVEVCGKFLHTIESLTQYPGRDLNPYDFYDCMTWLPTGMPVINTINGAYQKALIHSLIEEWKTWAVQGDRLKKFVDRSMFVSQQINGARIRGKEDLVKVKNDMEKRLKLLAYFHPRAYHKDYIQQFFVTARELKYIYEGVWE